MHVSSLSLFCSSSQKDNKAPLLNCTPNSKQPLKAKAEERESERGRKRPTPIACHPHPCGWRTTTGFTCEPTDSSQNATWRARRLLWLGLSGCSTARPLKAQLWPGKEGTVVFLKTLITHPTTIYFPVTLEPPGLAGEAQRTTSMSHNLSRPRFPLGD